MKGWFSADDIDERIKHALRVERFLITLGYIVAALGFIGIAIIVVEGLAGLMSWNRAAITAFGILGASVLSGVAAYGSGTNIGLSAMRLREQVNRGKPDSSEESAGSS